MPIFFLCLYLPLSVHLHLSIFLFPFLLIFLFLYASALPLSVSIALYFKSHRDDTRELWLVLTGLGAQWLGMGRDMMRLEAFADSISHSHRILETFGINLLNFITRANKDDFEDFVPSMTAMFAIQVIECGGQTINITAARCTCLMLQQQQQQQ